MRSYSLCAHTFFSVCRRTRAKRCRSVEQKRVSFTQLLDAERITEEQPPQHASVFASQHLNNELLTVVFLQTLCAKRNFLFHTVYKYVFLPHKKR